jgi:hypothetical protein
MIKSWVESIHNFHGADKMQGRFERLKAIYLKDPIFSKGKLCH